MQFPRNLSKDERRAFLDELNIEHVVYTRRQAFEEQIYEIPSRAFAMDIFERYFRSRRSVCPTSWHKNQHFLWEKNVTTKHMVGTMRDWARNHHSRFKFQIQRCYLLYKFDTNKPGSGRVWRIHYPSLNTKMPIPGETRGGWVAVHDGPSMDRVMTNLKNADIWADVKVESSLRVPFGACPPDPSCATTLSSKNCLEIVWVQSLNCRCYIPRASGESMWVRW